MNIAAMMFRLRASWVHSLKEKRMIVKSLTAQLQNKFHVSAAEHMDRKKAAEILNGLSDIEVLNKAGLTFKGKITRTALLLLGKPESAFYFDGFTPRITWTLYNADKTVKAYEHFDMPFLLAVDKVYAKIRSEKYRYIADQMTLFPEEVDQYDPDSIKEIINNCIAHSDYRLRGRINVEEFEDHLVFINGNSILKLINSVFSKKKKLMVLKKV